MAFFTREGKQLFKLKNCIECHNGSEKSAHITEKREGDWFKEHVYRESKIVVGKARSERRRRKYMNKEMSALDDFLFKTPKAQ